MSSLDTAEVDRFCDHLWLSDGLAPATLASYRQDMTRFFSWCDEQKLQPGDVTRSDIERYLAGQFAAQARASSVNRRLSTLKRFYRWRVDTGAAAFNPCDLIDAPRTARYLPKNLSEAQVEALLAAPDSATPLGERDRAMLETLYASGLRVSELVGLKLIQVNIEQGVVKILGKGSKERLVPLGEIAVEWIKRHLAGARALWLTATRRSDFLFLTVVRQIPASEITLLPGSKSSVIFSSRCAAFEAMADSLTAFQACSIASEGSKSAANILRSTSGKNFPCESSRR